MIPSSESPSGALLDLEIQYRLSNAPKMMQASNTRVDDDPQASFIGASLPTVYNDDIELLLTHHLPRLRAVLFSTLKLSSATNLNTIVAVKTRSNNVSKSRPATSR